MIFRDDGWISPYWPFGFMALFAIFFYVFADKINKHLAKTSKHFRIGKSLEVLEEGLDNYWVALNRRARQWTEKEETYRRHALGMQMMTDDQF